MYILNLCRLMPIVQLCTGCCRGNVLYCSVNATAGCNSLSFTTSRGDVPANNFCSEIVGLNDLTDACEIELF